MRLPNATSAFIDVRKLSEYALNPEDPVGRHKARVFASVLGLTAPDAEWLKAAILQEVLSSECVPGELDLHGQRYTVDCRIRTATGDATVRSGWIVRHGEDFPRLTTCFVLKERR